MFSLRQETLGVFAGIALTAAAVKADTVDPYQYSLTGTLGDDPFEIALVFEEQNPDTDSSEKFVVPSIEVLDGSFTWRGETVALPGWGPQLDLDFSSTHVRLFNVWFPNGETLVQTILAPKGDLPADLGFLDVLALQQNGSISLGSIDGVVEQVHFNGGGSTEVPVPEHMGTLGLGGAVAGLALMNSRRRRVAVDENATWGPCR